MRTAMKKPEEIDTDATWVLPKNEVAARRKIDLDATTKELEALTVHELEEHLRQVDDETRTDIQPVLEDPAK
jgi:hypothetical protein